MSIQIVDIEDRHLQARLALGCHTFECRQISIAPRCDTNYEIIRPWMKRTRSRQEAKASLRYSARKLSALNSRFGTKSRLFAFSLFHCASHRIREVKISHGTLTLSVSFTGRFTA